MQLFSNLWRRSAARTPAESGGRGAVRRHFTLASIAYAGFGIAGAFVVAAEPAALAQGLGPFLAFLVSPWMLATYILAAGFLAYGLWTLRRGARSAAAGGVDRLLRRQRLGVLLAFLLLALGLTAVGYLFARDLEASVRAQRRSEQASIARLKAQEVDKWLYERAIDVEGLGAAVQRLPLAELAASSETRQIAAVLFAELMASHPDVAAIALRAPDGGAPVRAGDPEALDGLDRAALATAPVGGGARILDRPAAPPALFDIVKPLDVGGKPQALLLQVVADPARSLFAGIGHWPSSSPTSRVLVVRHAGERTLALLPPGAPLPVLDGRSLGASLLEGEGVREGRDERGVDEIAAQARVQGIDWHVIAITDFDEVLRPLQRKIVVLSAVIAASIAAAGLIAFLLWRGQRAGFQELQELHRQDRAALARHFEESIRAARDIVLLYDPDGRILDCNEAAVAAYGYSAEELQGLQVRDLVIPEEIPRLQQHWPEGATPGGHLVEATHRRKDGTSFPVEISSHSVTIEGRTYRQAFVRNIGERKALERQVERLTRVLRALHTASGILLRARSQGELYDGMCRIAVDVAGYRLACVALANDDPEHSVTVVAFAGDDRGLLAQADIHWGDGPRAQGPVGTAIRTGEVQVVQDVAASPRVAPWRASIGTLGIHANIALPLRDGARCFGALAIYASQPDAFNDEEVAILTRFADDISYGVTALRARGASPA